MFDLILAGSSFASTFFLLGYLRHAPATARVLVIERGKDLTRQQFNQDYRSILQKSNELVDQTQSIKPWQFSIAKGGGSNCWWACTPRFLPEDFELRQKFGIAADWPLKYSDLAPYYEQVETLMSVSGGASPPGLTPIRYPQPAHLPNSVQRVLAENYPGMIIPQPTARARLATATRAACCASAICHTCPIGAKFTVNNDLTTPYLDPRVTIITEHEVLAVKTAANRVTGVICRAAEKEVEFDGDFIGLGTNTIFNPWILAQSGINSPILGRGIHEQMGIYLHYDLSSLNGLSGSTSITGLMYNLYSGVDRSTQAAGLVEIHNNPQHMRLEKNKWSQILTVKLILEDLPQMQNYVTLTGKKPAVYFKAYSDYTVQSVAPAIEQLESLLSVLPIERKVSQSKAPSEAHILGTTPMGNNPKTSIVDKDLLHHDYRNLAILGASTFTTGSPSNPTLTLSALSLRSAETIFGL